MLSSALCPGPPGRHYSAHFRHQSSTRAICYVAGPCAAGLVWRGLGQSIRQQRLATLFGRAAGPPGSSYGDEGHPIDTDQQLPSHGAAASAEGCTHTAHIPSSGGATAARRLYNAALADPLHDLSLDFDRTYLSCRCHISVPVCLGGLDSLDVTDPKESSRNGNAGRTAGMAGFQAYLQYQQLLHQDTQCSTSSSSETNSSSGAGSSSLDLLHCAVLLARHAYPSVCYSDIREVIDQLAGRAAAAAADAANTADAVSRVRAVVAAVNRIMFSEAGFSGAVEDFYHPDNHCINRLLETKQGSPALLALLYQQVAAAAGLQLTPVTLPGHTFLAPSAVVDAAGSNSSNSYDGPPSMGLCSSTYLIDPFNAGQVCSSSVVEARLNACWGYPGQSLALHITPPHNSSSKGGSSNNTDSPVLHGGEQQATSEIEEGTSSWCGSRALLVRLLKNLREAYYCPLPLSGRIRWALHHQHTRQLGGATQLADLLQTGSAVVGPELLTGALAIIRFHRATQPHEIRLLRDEGYILHLLGRAAEGKVLLQQYLAAAPAAADAHRVQEFVVSDLT